MKFNEKLARLRRENGLTLEDIARVCGVSRATVMRWENGEIQNPRRDKIEGLATALKCRTAYLMGWNGASDDAEEKESAHIPLYDHVPSDCTKPSGDYEEIPLQMMQHGDYFAMIIHGSSMEPRMLEGDVVLVRSGSSSCNGSLVAVCIGSREAVCRYCKQTSDGILLYGQNPLCEPEFFTNSEIHTLPIRILGRVVELRARF